MTEYVCTCQIICACVEIFSDIITLLEVLLEKENFKMFNMGGSAPEIKQLTVKEVPAGSTAVLNCHSNDVDHNFMFWLFNGTDVIGPGNVYNEQKYKYEVLSGKLHIHVSITAVVIPQG